MNKYLFFILFLFTALVLNGQNNKYFDDIKKTFDKKSREELTNASKAIKNAQKDFNAAEKLFSGKQISKALSKSKSASSIFKNSYRTIFTVYEKKLTSLIDKTDGDKREYLNRLMQDSKSNFRLSIYNRLKAGELKDEKEAYELLKTAHQKEIEAIDGLSTVFALLNGWETADYSVMKDDYTADNTFENNNTEDFDTRSFSVNDPALQSGYKFNHKIITTDGNENSEVVGNSDDYSNTGVNYQPTGNVKHEFRLQIGASILPANESQLKRLNKTDLPVKTYKSNVYYKYTVGSFKDFQEAKNYKNAYGLTDVYIVEYKDGKEVKVYLRDVLQ